MPLFSNAFTHDSNVRTRLELCQSEDRYHVVFGERGMHVDVIQAVLSTLMPDTVITTAKGTHSKTDQWGVYGTRTAEAVKKYKRDHNPPILNYKNAIDNIVGKQTISFLDDDMYVWEAKAMLLRGVKPISMRNRY